MRIHRWSWIDVLLVVMITAVLVLQFRLLYIFPQPDSARWWGDETGQMLELEAELQTGAAHIPTALGSSLAVTNGFIRGNSWMAAIVYGLPVAIFDGIADVVTVGRTMTALIAIFLTLVVFRLVRRTTGSVTAGLLAVLLLVTTRAFFFGTHAARLDTVAGLAIVLAAMYLAKKHESRHHLEPVAWRWWVVMGVMFILLSTLSIHLLTTGAILLLYLLWNFRAFTLRNIGGLALGAAAMLGILLAIYGLSGAPPTLFTKTAVSNQFESVAYGLPILRPFSRSVQVANILERVDGLWSEAPVVLVLAVLSLLLRFVRPGVREHQVRFLTGFGLAVLVAWLFFESPALYYYMQVLPIFIATLVISCHAAITERPVAKAIMFAMGVVVTFFAVKDTFVARKLSHAIAVQNEAALIEARRAIDISPIRHTPLVLAQNPAIDRFNSIPTVRLMTPHIISFPTSRAPIEDQLSQLGVDFLLLYSLPGGTDYSQEYGVLRRVAARSGLKLAEWHGTLFDVDRDYFHPDLTRQDTLTLYRLVR